MYIQLIVFFNLRDKYLFQIQGLFLTLRHLSKFKLFMPCSKIGKISPEIVYL